MTPDEIALDPIAAAVRQTALGRYVTDRCRLEGDCWIWTGATNGDGYAQMNTGRFGKALAHKALYETVRGPLAAGKRLANTCGVRACCNPEHWAPKSPGRIIAEQYRSGARAGERLYYACLKGHMRRRRCVGSFERAEQARQLRDAGLNYQQIGAALGVSEVTAKRWVSGRSWRRPSPFGV